MTPQSPLSPSIFSLRILSFSFNSYLTSFCVSSPDLHTTIFCQASSRLHPCTFLVCFLSSFFHLFLSQHFYRRSNSKHYLVLLFLPLSFPPASKSSVSFFCLEILSDVIIFKQALAFRIQFINYEVSLVGGQALGFYKVPWRQLSLQHTHCCINKVDLN